MSAKDVYRGIVFRHIWLSSSCTSNLCSFLICSLIFLFLLVRLRSWIGWLIIFSLEQAFDVFDLLCIFLFLTWDVDNCCHVFHYRYERCFDPGNMQSSSLLFLGDREGQVGRLLRIFQTLRFVFLSQSAALHLVEVIWRWSHALTTGFPPST